MCKVDLQCMIEPRWCHAAPLVEIHLDDEQVYDNALENTQTICFSRYLRRGCHVLKIGLHSKSDFDPDQALCILDLRFGGISSKRAIWRGKYQPQYPEPWASQQRSAGLNLEPVLTNTDYLGWNGIWSLQFDVPVFTWLHRVENLGWIYD